VLMKHYGTLWVIPTGGRDEEKGQLLVNSEAHTLCIRAR
jgi:hypothetical protein